MDERYKSLAALKPDAWIKHFRSTVGKPSSWNDQPQLVIIKRSKEGDSASATSGSSDVPLNVVSPIEQYANMAQAEMDKKTPVYKPQSVSSKISKKNHQLKRKQNSKPHKSGQSSIKGEKKRKVSKDIFSK